MVGYTNADGINNVSTIEMATGAPNAILAINSLDRYIDTLITTYASFQATWANGATVLTLTNSSPPYSPPKIGAYLVAPGLDNNPRTTITAVVGNQITIDTPTTAAQVAPANVTQIYQVSNPSQPISNSLYGQYNNRTPYANDFILQSPNYLINGYIQRIVVSQLQIQYNIPTVNSGLNDTFWIFDQTNAQFYEITIPYGFLTPQELAAILQTEIATPSIIPDMTVTFDPQYGFVFNSAASQFYFPAPDELDLLGVVVMTDALKNNIYKTLRLLGMTIEQGGGNAANQQISGDYPNFLYTPYIDFYSDILTNYQNVKDTDSSVQKRKGLIARVYLSGAGSPVVTGLMTALGSSSFVVTADLNSPKVIKWTPDTSVPSIDFQLRDCYGNLIPGYEFGFFTEWNMTLLCVEGREWNS